MAFRASAVQLTGQQCKNIYFGAVALGGAGIRFYGDLCLVLKAEKVPADTVILDRNSYDLVRSPLKERIEKANTPAEERESQAKALSGTWGKDLHAIAAIKVLHQRRCDKRRLTTGQIADTVLEDEDYIEVLKEGSFGPGDLQEVRTSAAEAAAEERIRRRCRTGTPPSMEEVVWLRRRKQAERAFARRGLDVRVVTTSGRVKP